MVVWVNSQTIRFNNTYDPFIYGTARSIIEYGDGYIIVGGGLDSLSSPNKYELIVTCVDSIGELKWYKSFGDTIYNYYHGMHSSLKRLDNGNFIVAGARANNEIYAGVLYMFDENFDTLWMKTYFEDTTGTIFYNCIEAYDGGFLLVGASKDDLMGGVLEHSDVILVKTDINGNMEWAKRYGGDNLDWGFQVEKTFDNGYLLGGYTMSFGIVAPGHRGEWYVVKIDSLGNQQFEQHYGNPNYDDGFLSDILPTSDSSYLFIGSKAIYYDVFPYYQGRIIKFKEGEGVIWDKLYGNITLGTTFVSIIELEDNSLVATHIEQEYSNRSFLRKFTSEGDSLWIRSYDAQGCTYDQILTQVIQTEDKGFAIAGYGYVDQKIWVVKTDSLGCDSVGGCDYTFINENILPEGKGMVLYPNPANKHVKCQMSNVRCQMLGVVQIYDIQGRKRIEIRDFDLEGEIDVSGLGNGIYFVRVIVGTKVFSEKLVIQR